MGNLLIVCYLRNEWSRMRSVVRRSIVFWFWCNNFLHNVLSWLQTLVFIFWCLNHLLHYFIIISKQLLKFVVRWRLETCRLMNWLRFSKIILRFYLRVSLLFFWRIFYSSFDFFIFRRCSFFLRISFVGTFKHFRNGRFGFDFIVSDRFYVKKSLHLLAAGDTTFVLLFQEGRCFEGVDSLSLLLTLLSLICIYLETS